MMASIVPLRLLFGFIFVLNTFPVKVLSYPLELYDGESLETVELFWIKHGCVFPALSAYKKNELLPGGSLLEICRSPKAMTDEENFVTSLCSLFIKTSRLLCRAPLSSIQKQHLEEKSLNEYVLNSSWDVCVYAKNSPVFSQFSFMTDKELCEKNCVRNNVIAPVCRLLVAAVVKYEETVNVEKIDGTGSSETTRRNEQPQNNTGTSSNTSNISNRTFSTGKEDSSETKELKPAQDATGNEKTQVELEGTTKTINQPLKIGNGTTLKSREQGRTTELPLNDSKSTPQVETGSKNATRSNEPFPPGKTEVSEGEIDNTTGTGNDGQGLKVAKSNLTKSITGTGNGTKTDIHEQPLSVNHTIHSDNTTLKGGSGNDTETGNNGLNGNINRTMQTTGGGDKAVGEQFLKNDEGTGMRTGGGDMSGTEEKALPTATDGTGKDDTEANKNLGAGDSIETGGTGQLQRDGDKTTMRTVIGGDANSNLSKAGETAENKATLDDHTYFDSRGSTTITTSKPDEDQSNPSAEHHKDEGDTDRLGPESEELQEGADGKDDRNGIAQNVEMIPMRTPKIPETPVGRPVGINFEEAEPPSGHFMAYFLTAVVLCVAGYVIYHNKKKIMAFILEGRRDIQQRRRTSGTSGSGSTGGSTAKYHKLQPSVEEVMPSLEKSTTSKDYIY